MNSLIGKHLVDAADLIAGGDDEGDHGRAISSGRLQILDELLHLEDLDLWCSWLWTNKIWESVIKRCKWVRRKEMEADKNAMQDKGQVGWSLP